MLFFRDCTMIAIVLCWFRPRIDSMKSETVILFGFYIIPFLFLLGMAKWNHVLFPFCTER